MKEFEIDPEITEKFGDYKKFLSDWRQGNIANVTGRCRNALLEMEETINRLQSENAQLTKDRDDARETAASWRKACQDQLDANTRYVHAFEAFKCAHGIAKHESFAEHYGSKEARNA